MKNIYQKLVFASSGVILSLSPLTMSMPAEAVSMTRYDFSVEILGMGKNESGYFTFDSLGQETQIYSNQVVKKVLDFEFNSEFNWLNETYEEEALDFQNDADGVLFENGVFQELDWDYAPSRRLFRDLERDEFVYNDFSAGLSNTEGEGLVSYQKKEQVSSVPEPGVVIGLGLVSLGFLLNKKKLSNR